MNAQVYHDRRQALREAVSDGTILLLASNDAPRNYEDNVYPYRQDSHFLYYVGVSQQGMAALLYPDGRQVLFGHPETRDDLVWSGPRPTLEDHAEAAGFSEFEDMANLEDAVRAIDGGIHYLPPYRGERILQLAQLLGIDPRTVDDGISKELMRAVVDQRSVKSAAEVDEIEAALAITAEMYAASFAFASAGRKEAEVVARHVLAALARGSHQAFNPIVSVHGEVLHNTSYGNTLQDGDLLLIDSGAESSLFYASDITRTFPVSGRFTTRQREIYEIVLQSQLDAIGACAPGVTNREIHGVAARTIAAGLNSLGILKGDVDEAVAAGAHALFFPHGIGHMMGVDVHDMEDLGDIVGYDEGVSRSAQFGLSALRLARRLDPGFVITIEPGIYFIPELIKMWREEERHMDFINYQALEPYFDFGGIRIEDDVLITDKGFRVLGPGIPKSVDELEGALNV